MIEKRPTTSIKSLDALLSENAELHESISKLQDEVRHRDGAIADLQSRLNQYWDLHDDIDYRSLVDRIREEARSVGDVLRSLDLGTRRKLAHLGTELAPDGDRAVVPGKRLLPRVHSLLRTLDEWK